MALSLKAMDCSKMETNKSKIRRIKACCRRNVKSVVSKRAFPG
jgi:hypothetical protein